MHQWRAIFSDVLSATKIKWSTSDEKQFVDNLCKGSGDVQAACALYYWLHWYIEIDEESGKPHHPYKSIAQRLDIHAYGKHLDIAFPERSKGFAEKSDTADEMKSSASEKEEINSVPANRKFSRLLEKHTKDYFERKAINKEVDEFLSEHDRGIITVEGHSGTGKSALLANIVKRYLLSKELAQSFFCVYHFIQHGSDSSRTISFLENLTDQLITLFNLDSFIEESTKKKWIETGRYSAYLDSLLEYVSLQIHDGKSQKLVIYVDAIDEIYRADSSLNSTSNAFFIPQYPPKGIFFVVSGRTLDAQRFDRESILEISLNEDGAHQTNDVRDYIESRLDISHIEEWRQQRFLKRHEFIELFVKLSELKFIYLFHIFQELDRFTDLNALPRGHNAYYLGEYKRLIDGQEHLSDGINLLVSALVNFKPAISFERLKTFCGLKNKHITTILSDWYRIVNATPNPRLFAADF